MDLGADDFASAWPVEDPVYSYAPSHSEEIPIYNQEQSPYTNWNSYQRPVSAPLYGPAEDLAAVGTAPYFIPESNPRNSSMQPNVSYIPQEPHLKRRKLDSNPPAAHYSVHQLHRGAFTTEHLYNPACGCDSCSSRTNSMHYRPAVPPHGTFVPDNVPSPFLSPVTPSLMSSTNTPASAASTPTAGVTPVSAPSTKSSSRSKTSRSSETDRYDEDASDSEDELSLGGADDGALDDDDDEFNSDDAEMQSRRRSRKRSRSSSSAFVDPYLLPKSAPSQNPERLITIAPGVEVTVGKLLNMTTAEIKEMKLTAEEEESLKKQRRLLRNRESAAMSRAKRRDLLSTLEARSQDLITKLKKLDSQIDEMKKNNADLRTKIVHAKKTGKRSSAASHAPAAGAAASTVISAAPVATAAQSRAAPHPVPIKTQQPSHPPQNFQAPQLIPIKTETQFSEAYPTHPAQQYLSAPPHVTYRDPQPPIHHRQYPAPPVANTPVGYGQPYYAPPVEQQFVGDRLVTPPTSIYNAPPPTMYGRYHGETPEWVPPVPAHHHGHPPRARVAPHYQDQFSAFPSHQPTKPY